MKVRTLSFLLAASIGASGQVLTPASSTADGLQILQRLAQRYSEARSYNLAEVEERTSTTENSRTWQRTTLAASEMPGNRFRFEGTSETGAALRVSDGRTTWAYRKNEHSYTEKESIKPKDHPTAVAMSEMALMQAERLRSELGGIATHLKSAEHLGDQTIISNGRKTLCEVIRVRETDQKRFSPQYTFEKMIFIDRSRGVIVRTVESARTYLQSGSARIPMTEKISVNFSKSDLDAKVPESLFSFVPPPDAALIENFPDPMKENGVPNLEGKTLPSFPLKPATGNAIDLNSFRGHPVLLDVWATWCGPCVAALPLLQNIYKEANEKGLVLISIDQDEEASTATEFLRKKGYT